MRGLVLAIVFAAALPSLAAWGQPLEAEHVATSTFAVELRPRTPDERVAGRLRYLGGIVIRAEDPRFSGISGLHFTHDGEQLLGISDRGYWLSFRPTFSGESLTGIAEARVWPMLDGSGSPLQEPAYDAESLTIVDDTAYVGFERIHRIEAYAVHMGENNPYPDEYRGAATFGERANNGSLEGLTALADGRLLAFAEAANEDRTFDGWLMDADGTTQSLALFAVAPYSLTDLATLPDGDVVTLERRFSPVGGVGARLRLIPTERIAAGALLDGEELAELGAGFTVDNMEGLAVRARDGRTELFLVSDDNQNPLQRTILLAFELVED